MLCIGDTGVYWGYCWISVEVDAMYWGYWWVFGILVDIVGS